MESSNQPFVGFGRIANLLGWDRKSRKSDWDETVGTICGSNECKVFNVSNITQEDINASTAETSSFVQKPQELGGREKPYWYLRPPCAVKSSNHTFIHDSSYKNLIPNQRYMQTNFHETKQNNNGEVQIFIRNKTAKTEVSIWNLLTRLAAKCNFRKQTHTRLETIIQNVNKKTVQEGLCTDPKKQSDDALQLSD